MHRDRAGWPDLATQRARYEQHDNREADAGYVAHLEYLATPMLARLPAAARGLDFGCGPDPVLATLFERRGHRMRSWDPIFHPDPAALDATYDFVTCAEVLEHVGDARGVLAQLDRLLRPGGLLGVMTQWVSPERSFEDWWYRRDPTHVCFYARATLERVADIMGWRVELLQNPVSIYRSLVSGG